MPVKKVTGPIPESISLSEIATLSGLTTRQVSSLTQMGILFKNCDGNYDTRDSIKNFFSYYRNKGNISVNNRIKEAQAEKLEFANQLQRRELISLDELAEILARILGPLRDDLRDMSGKIAKQCNQYDPEGAGEVISRETTRVKEKTFKAYHAEFNKEIQ